MEGERVSHYRIEKRLGRGGMGEVYAGVDVNLDRPVALKFIAPEFATNEETLKRFEREARSAAALNHPNIATLYAFERDDRPLIAMELLTGETLRERMREGPLPVAEALGYARDVAAGLALAHRRGVIHRDIKPENLMFDDEGSIKIVDFGLARAAQASRLTMTGSTLGTAAYMSPEAIRGEGSAASDVWALGVILYEMLSGASPFGTDDNPLAKMYVITNEDPRPLVEIRADVPREIGELVDALLVKQPENRVDAATVAQTLAEWTGTALPAGTTATGRHERQGGVSVAGTADPDSPEASQRTEELEVERLTRENPELPTRSPGGSLAHVRRRRGRMPLVIVAMVLLVAAGWGLLQITGRNTRLSPEAERESLRLNNEGQQAMLSGDLDAARALLERALAANPESGAALINLGLVYGQLSLTASAESLFTQALEYSADPNIVAQAHYNLGSLDMDAGAWSSAITHLQESLQQDSSWAGPYNNLGYALIRSGRVNEGVTVLERGLARFPGQPPLLKNHSLALMSQNRLEEALQQIESALLLDPTYTAANGVRARILARRGDLQGAARDFDLYLTGNPPRDEAQQVTADLAALGVEVRPASSPPQTTAPPGS